MANNLFKPQEERVKSLSDAYPDIPVEKIKEAVAMQDLALEEGNMLLPLGSLLNIPLTPPPYMSTKWKDPEAKTYTIVKDEK